jgi:hypothetical protein
LRILPRVSAERIAAGHRAETPPCFSSAYIDAEDVSIHTRRDIHVPVNCAARRRARRNRSASRFTKFFQRFSRPWINRVHPIAGAKQNARHMLTIARPIDESTPSRRILRTNLTRCLHLFPPSLNARGGVNRHDRPSRSRRIEQAVHDDRRALNIRHAIARAKRPRDLQIAHVLARDLFQRRITPSTSITLRARPPRKRLRADFGGRRQFVGLRRWDNLKLRQCRARFRIFEFPHCRPRDVSNHHRS